MATKPTHGGAGTTEDHASHRTQSHAHHLRIAQRAIGSMLREGVDHARQRVNVVAPKLPPLPRVPRAQLVVLAAVDGRDQFHTGAAAQQSGKRPRWQGQRRRAHADGVSGAICMK